MPRQDLYDSEAWTECAPGTLGELSHSLQRARRRKTVGRVGLPPLVLALVSLGVWSVNAPTRPSEFTFGGVCCSEVQAKLPQYAAGGLEQDDRRAVGIHLQRCPICQQKMRAMQGQMLSLMSATFALSNGREITVRCLLARSGAVRSRGRLITGAMAAIIETRPKNALKFQPSQKHRYRVRKLPQSGPRISGHTEFLEYGNKIMLVLSRKPGQRIVICFGDQVATITVLKIQGNRVQIGIEAPSGIGVHRQEVWARLSSEIDPLGDGVAEQARAVA